jgi:hypothetical protein
MNIYDAWSTRCTSKGTVSQIKHFVARRIYSVAIIVERVPFSEETKKNCVHTSDTLVNNWRRIPSIQAVVNGNSTNRQQHVRNLNEYKYVLKSKQKTKLLFAKKFVLRNTKIIQKVRNSKPCSECNLEPNILNPLVFWLLLETQHYQINLGLNNGNRKLIGRGGKMTSISCNLIYHNL